MASGNELQLSNNGNYPQIHNGKVVWEGSDATDSEIFYWDGTSVQNISNNSSLIDDTSPQIHNGQVVWSADEWPNDYEIYYWDGTSTKQLTDNSIDEMWPQIHDGQVAWNGYDGNDYEIFLWKEDILEVIIDIKPGSYLNSINLKSRGKIPVAILTTADFDANYVDPNTCVFASAEPLRWNREDVDHDGDYDMLFHFMTQELELTNECNEATLEGETIDGVQITGTDSVNIVPKINMHSKKAKKNKKK